MSAGPAVPPVPKPAAPANDNLRVVVVVVVMFAIALGVQYLGRHLRLEWVSTPKPSPVKPVDPTPPAPPAPKPRPAFPTTWYLGGFSTHA